LAYNRGAEQIKKQKGNKNMDWLYRQFVVGKQKAIAGWLATALVAFLVANGVKLPSDAADVLTALLWGIIGLVSVYLKRNQD
jgi:uncharacterized membrane protein (DUF441 family)